MTFARFIHVSAALAPITQAFLDPGRLAIGVLRVGERPRLREGPCQADGYQSQPNSARSAARNALIAS